MDRAPTRARPRLLSFQVMIIPITEALSGAGGGGATAIGAVQVINSADGNPFGESDVALLVVVAEQLGLVMRKQAAERATRLGDVGGGDEAGALLPSCVGRSWWCEMVVLLCFACPFEVPSAEKAENPRVFFFDAATLRCLATKDGTLPLRFAVLVREVSHSTVRAVVGVSPRAAVVCLCARLSRLRDEV